MKPNINSKEYEAAISVERMRESDRYTIENFADSKTLMYRAAAGIFSSADWSHKKIAIITGSGNNGGDGYALACILRDNGFSADIFRASERFSDDGKYYYDLAVSKGANNLPFLADTNLCGYDIVVDCLLGTGFSGEPCGTIADAIKAINSSGAFVISADINSGLNGDTGESILAVKSDLTVSIGFYKKGMFLGNAPSLVGELVNIDIGIVLI